MFVRVSYLCLVGIVLFLTMETVLSEEDEKNPDTSALYKRKLKREEEDSMETPDARSTFKRDSIEPPDARPTFKRLLRRRARKVAFTAYLGNQKIKRNKQAIRYSRITLNIGRAYRRGIFRAPVSGVYVFFFTSMPQRGKGDALWLMKNGRRVVESVSGRVSSAYNMGSNMAILYLRRGNKVWVQTSPTWKFSKIYRYRYSANSFSGFRLY
ncbi:complement C1q tumor necrosis factor-related protein 3-like [Saccostrea cucullata]|uniref:complement C1q tumor necrosis factor-related protein 3-like n=1 Tax=Saccostrea cuccullata TaxID=36930 RepID=UPI002ED450F6